MNSFERSNMKGHIIEMKQKDTEVKMSDLIDSWEITTTTPCYQQLLSDLKMSNIAAEKWNEKLENQFQVLCVSMFS